MAIVITSLTPTNPTTPAGSSVVFNIGASEDTGLTLSYEWQYSTDGLNYSSSGLSNNTSNSYDTGPLQASQTGIYYRCVVSTTNEVVNSNEVAGIGDRIVSVFQDPSILTFVDSSVDFFPTSQIKSVGDTLILTVTASLANADITNSTLVSNLAFQWQYSEDSGSTWFNITAGGDTSISDTVSQITGATTWMKYTTLSIQNLTFDENLIQYRVRVSYTGALNTPVDTPVSQLIIDPVINIIQQPGVNALDTQTTDCYKTSIADSGDVRVSVSALTTAGTQLTYSWEVNFSGPGGTGEWYAVDQITNFYVFILKPGTTADSEVLELERFIYYDRPGFRCVITGTSGEASVITTPHYIYMTDVEGTVDLPAVSYDIDEDRYGDIVDRDIYINDPVQDISITAEQDVQRNTGQNGNNTYTWQRQDPGSSTWTDLADPAPVTVTTEDGLVSYTQFPTTLGNETVDITVQTPPLRVSVDDGAKYRLKVESSSRFTLSGGNKVITPYYSDEIDINVYPTVYVTNQPGDAEAYPNYGTGFSVTATPSSGVVSDITYQWQYNTSNSITGWSNISNVSPYSGATTNLLTVNPIPAGLTYTYFRCVLSIPGQLSSVTSGIAQLTLLRDYFTALSALNDVVVNEFDNHTFSVTASSVSAGPISFQWERSTNYNPATNTGTWTTLSGEVGSSFDILSATTSSTSIYTTIGLETYTSTHNAPILFTQALDDDAGNYNQASWLQDYYNDIVSIPTNATATLTTVTSGGHNAFTTDATLQAAIRNAVGSNAGSGAINNAEFAIAPSDGYTFPLNGTSYPIMGRLYVPIGLTASQVDVVVLFHGTLTEGGGSTIGQAATDMLERFVGTDTNSANYTDLNIRDKIIFSVAYPQDHISNTRQFNLPGVGTETPTFLMGDNLPYARAAVEWVKTNLNGYIAAQGGSKTIGDVYLFGHSQGGKIVSKINTLDSGIAGVIANAPGPIQFDQTCTTAGGTTCNKVAAIYGSPSAPGPSDEGYYRVKCTSSGGEVLYSNAAQLTIQEVNISIITNITSAVSVIEGESAAFTFECEGLSSVNTEVSYQWEIKRTADTSFSPIGSGHNNSVDTERIYVLRALDNQTDNGAKIRCKMTAPDVPGQVYTNECTLTVVRRFTYFADTATKVVTIGDRLSISLNPSFTGGTPAYSWEENGVALGETGDVLVIPNIDSSYNGKTYRCRVTLDGCTQHVYDRNNVVNIVTVSGPTYTVPVTISTTAAPSKPVFYSNETSKSGAAIGTVICIPKPADYTASGASTGDDAHRWGCARSGTAYPGTLNTSSRRDVNNKTTYHDGDVWSANKPSWASNAYISPKWLISKDRFPGFIELRGQTIRASEFPELARHFGTKFGGTITGSYPNYNSNDTFEVPMTYAKRLLGTGNINNNAGSVSVVPTFAPDGNSGGDKNVPGSMGGVYNYVQSAQLPPGSPGLPSLPDGTADGSVNAATFSIGSYQTTGIEDVTSFAQPSFAGQVNYTVGNPGPAFTDLPTHSHSAVAVGWRETQPISNANCFSTYEQLNGGTFKFTTGDGGSLENSTTTEGEIHSHTITNVGPGTFNMVTDAGMNITDTTLRFTGANASIMNNNISFFLRNNERVPMNAPYFRLKYLIKAY